MIDLKIFKNLEAVGSLRRELFNGDITTDMEDLKQSNLLNEISIYSHRVITKNKVKIQQKKDTVESINAINKGGNVVFNYFKRRILLIKIPIKGDKIKILSSKQQLQRLQIAFAQIKAGKTSESLLNKIRKVV